MSRLHDLAAEHGTPYLARLARIPAARVTGVLAGRMKLPATSILELVRAGLLTEQEAGEVWWGLLTDDERKLSLIVTRWCRLSEVG